MKRQRKDPAAPQPFGSDTALIHFMSAERGLIERQVRGLVVGRFFVRGRIEGEYAVQRQIDGVVRPTLDWYVTHLGTGFSWNFAKLDVALMVADELSRHARVDPSTTDRNDIRSLERQLGRSLWLWIESLDDEAESVPSFRAWLASSVGQGVADVR